MPAPTWVDFYNTLMAGAQQASVRRANDGTAGIGWSRSAAEQSAMSKGSKSFADRAWNDNLSVGKRLLDILSRPNYASASFKSAQNKAAKDNRTDFLGRTLDSLGDLGEAAGAGWEGLSGRSKKTFIDVNREQYGTPDEQNIGGFWNPLKDLQAIGSFAEDVALDPTTYIGAGAIKSAVNAVRRTGKSAKITEAAVQPVKKRAAEELGVTGKATVPVGRAEEFIRDVTRNAQNPGDAFDNVVKTQVDNGPALVGRIIPEGERSFVAGGEGIEEVLTHPDRIYNERFMLPGPSADVVSARARTSQLNELAKGIPQFEYGSAVDDLDETGFFREITERRPVNDVPQVRPVGTAVKNANDEWADLPPVTNPNPIRNAILRKNDEPVFGAYEKFVDERGIESFRPAKGAPQSTVGELRRLIDKTGDERAKAMLLNHLKTVEEYANNLAAKGPDVSGYGTVKGYMKDEYPEQWEAARVALGGRPAAKKPGELDFSDLPEGPMAVKPKEPTYTEIKRIEKMDFFDKMVYLHQFEGKLSKKDLSYLASASNPKSFATRMQNIKNRVRAEGTRDIEDLVDAIETGRIQSVDEPGISEVMEQVGAKSLAGLKKKLQEHLARQSKAEKNMLGNIAERPVTVESREAGTVKELGPTGLPYAAYSGRAEEALAKAQEIIDARPLPAAEIVQKAKAGDKTPLARPVSTLNVEQSKIFDRAMKWAVDQDVISPRNKELWAYVTRRGTLRTSPVAGAGKGRNRGAWNKYSQYTFFKDMMQNAEKIDPAIKKVLDDASIRGADRSYARASAMYEMMMPVLKAMDDVLKQGGVFPVAGKAVGDNPFSLFDVLHALPEEFVKRNVFTLRKTKQGVSSVIAPTQLMDITNYLVDVAKQGEDITQTRDDVMNLLMERQKTRNGKEVPNGLADMLKGKPQEVIEDTLDDVATDIATAMPELVQRVERNLAERKLWHEEQVTKGTQQALEVLADRITDPTFSPADIAGLADNVKIGVVDKVTRLHGIDPDDAWMVQQEVTAKMPELGMGPEVAAQGRAINKMAKAKTKSERVKVGVETSRMAEEESAKLAEELGIPLSDLGTRIEQSIFYKMLKAFSPHLGNKDVRPYFLDRKSLTQNLGRGYQALISDINKKHTKDAIRVAWKEAQRGTRSTNPEVAKAQDDIQQAINTFFSQDPNYNVFSRNNISAADVNAHLDHYKVPDRFRFSDDGLNDAWREWDTEDPLDLLAKMQAATMGAMSKRLLGDDLSFRFGSATKKEGHVKLSSHKTVLAKYLDLDLYYPREVAQQFKVLDDFIKQTMKPTEFRPVVNMLDNVLHSYKAGLTIYRPGHHVRNMVGDVWLAHMAGVNDPRYYTKAAKVMAANHGRYRDFDAIKALMARQPVDVNGGRFVDDGRPIVRLRNGQTMTMGDVYRAAYDQGILNDYRTLEDIQMGAESFSDTLRKVSPFKGRVNKAAASFSEARDHYVRLAHFMNDLEKGTFKNIDEAVTKAAHNVRKWHPDGSDLTHFESAAMRRIFLFYSWIRKAMPLVVESLVMQPGKVMMYPKAMYNIAEANGIDLESMGDPYPTDQLFPDWITDSPIGPWMQTDEGRYLGANPGVPAIDVLNDYAGTQAGPTIAGSLNPFLKIPSELAMSAHGGDASIATDWRTGIKAYDKSDYADRQIPGFGYVANITGRSPSQLFLEAKGGADKEAEGNPLAFYNLLSGMGVFDMSKPSYQRQARKDAKSRYQRSLGGQ